MVDHVQVLMDMKDETVSAKYLAPIVKMSESVIVKYAKEESSVHVTLSGEDQTAAVLFENESSEELLKSGEELEERFVRGDSSRNSEGSGLGLSIAGSLTELMGGTFAVTTEGSMFRAELKFPLL